MNVVSFTVAQQKSLKFFNYTSLDGMINIDFSSIVICQQ